MKRMLRSLAVCTAAAMFPAMAVGDTLESVQKTIIEQGKKINSMSWKSNYTQDMDMGTSKMAGEGTTAYEFTKSGDQNLSRTEMSYTTETTTDGKKQTVKGETLSVCDGKSTYVYTNSGGTKSAFKQAVQKQDAGMTKAYFDNMAQSYNLELQPDSKVGARATYVIKATTKETMPGMASEQMMFFDKETGVMLRSVHKDKAGKVTMETTTTDLKVNSTIAADRFVFKAPEGVEVMDMTQQGGQGQPAQQQKTATAADDSSKSESVKSSEESETKDEAGDEGKKKKKKSKWLKFPKKKLP